MCYAIPGKITKIDGNIVTLDYFGEERRARNEFYQFALGEYAYAQGGLIVGRIREKEALPALEAWKEVFVKLKEVDRRLAFNPKDLRQTANAERQKHLGNACCVHGIIEFSNYCANNCLYCGIQNSNKKLKRYRMSEEEIVDACDYAVNKLGFKAMVMQSGEDGWYTEEKLINIVSGIRKKCECLLILSIGERSASTYKKFYDLGVRAALLRFETSDEALYTKMRPGHKLQARLNLLRELGRMGYLLMSGFLIGLPGQSEDSIMADIDLTASLGVEMFSFGPFISHPDTPLAKLPSAAMDMALDTIAKARLKYPDAKILATTALESLDKINGLKNALLAGANSLMINVTPPKHQPFYEIYPGHSAKVVDVEKKIEETIALLRSIGRAPADLGI
ncbi:MAG: [FeFe] hydrogenase H-cluster radical SAM maturase HydE [Candidatus Omnitrophica bacterium CG12_big_fil_rev_8_21_14_0_65_43_15]|uniref:[FeFe] hydrogenase H-cluster radical SAM maturase HydE n=1 Tax=Candidatus Taenaricola geysiri TaxID=1974752 RepID=A0A2J0LED6_9BACT|nr:MAG: [FeFe] hydrogenase H-cluster radical SAM maturase HydE [Candidatus Omnitrophica bacterium CG10_big_fil_rev_8_21_14_0_10_43_8]PIV12160.1 MAG: [FeFe] hydrogenase H-cluster radical SAM maturase HydE [Candidatus Omnitrophica bacterium CG03_land_8_20_14_0_80_43_22]PIW66208.1 MAG: [FeFe] hydrogenase H-cluster radical SAM maturase HydE [Candidatus Omnitrophica bacterium CG12_big_fil_rev_8_21_14_0_65_43_15]PIW80590.1 MAG: [FeFe] hydrogenase H-cluster radical SAM maturase HydE [Candidatus Omnitro